MISATRRTPAPIAAIRTYRPVGRLALFLLIALVARTASAAELYAEYHDLTSTQHTTQVASLESTGYRPISLSVSGDPADPRYTGVWVQRAGPVFSVFQDKTLAEYQTILTGLAASEQPVIVGATGADDATARFAGVIETTSRAYVAKQGISVAELQAESIHHLNDTGFIPRWLTVYGTAGAPRYAAIWEANAQNVSYEFSYDSVKSQQRQALAIYKRNGIRPSLVVVTPNGTYSSFWEDDRLSGGWKLFDTLSEAQYEKKITALAKTGWQVVRAVARGTGAATRYTAIFAKTDVVQARQWQLTGSNDPNFAAFDAWVQARMQLERIRAGQLAIVRDGRLVYARAYTWAESDYPLTQPTDLFRTASCTKPLTSILINQLIDQGVLHANDTMQSILDLHPPGGGAVADSRLNDITVAQMLAHAAGWDRSVAGDFLFMDDVIADFVDAKLPVTKSGIASFVAAQSLQFPPDNGLAYSNVGYFLLGQIIEKLRPGHTYAQTAKDFIFKPLGLKRPKMWNSVRSTPPEVHYEPRDPYIGTTVMNPSGRQALINYGGYNLNNSIPAGGVVMSAPDYAKILAAFDQPTNPLLTQASVDFMCTPHYLGYDYCHGWWNTTVKDEDGNDVLAYHHDGTIDGSASLIFHRADGISFVLLFNRNVATYLWGGAEADGGQLNDLANQVTTWPTGDLFPDYGIPSF